MLPSTRRIRTKEAHRASWLPAWLPAVLILILLAYLSYSKLQARRARTEANEQAAQQQSAFVAQSQVFTAAAGQHVQQLQDLQQRIAGLEERLAQAISAGAQQQAISSALCRPAMPAGQATEAGKHKLAVIFPHRGRDQQLAQAIPALHQFLTAQNRSFDIFILQQSPGLRFNRGALLNAGMLLLSGSQYDHFCFHDVDTLPTLQGNMPYAHPSGDRPLHLTPKGFHPRVNYEDFAGGIMVFTEAQLRALNGYGTHFWGWGREDDNMRMRLEHQGWWPPEIPQVPHRGRSFYFHHAYHQKAQEVRVHTAGSEAGHTFEVNPDKPYEQDLIVSSQPGVLDNFATGLNSTLFSVLAVQSYNAMAVRFTVQLYCDRTSTPWCEE